GGGGGRGGHAAGGWRGRPLGRRPPGGFSPPGPAGPATGLPPARTIPSPPPGAPPAPAVLSTYSPGPISGESPTRPGSLCASPEVEHTPPSAPVRSSARTVTVSWLPSEGNVPSGARSPLAGPAGLRPSPPAGARVLYHSDTLWGVCRVSRGNPCASAKRWAPAPTRRTCGVFSITRRATAAAWLTFSSPATAPQPSPLPSITQASSVTFPAASP